MNTVSTFASASLVIGLALIISSVGWQLWRFRVGKSISGIPFVAVMLDLGTLLFCVSLSLIVDQLWAGILFTILAVAFAIMAILDLRNSSREHL